MRISRINSSIALQRSEIIGIAEFSPQFLEDGPIALLPFMSNLTFQLAFQISRHAIVIEQRVVHVEQKHDGVRFCGHRGSLIAVSHRRKSPGGASGTG